MENLKTKTKEWYDKNKESIKKGVETVFDIGIEFGLFVFVAYGSMKITEHQIGRGIERAHYNGLIKFFNPSTGAEVDIYEATKLFSELADKVHK